MNHKEKSLKLEARQERYKEILKNLTILSDVLMRNVFKKRECTEYVLQIILNQRDLKIVDQVLQKDYKNLQGRSAILDCVVRDTKGRQFNVEIQQESEGASPKRARYHSGLVDMNTLLPGQDFEELPETYIIFITRKDTLGYDLPIYHIRRRIEETGEDFRDEAYLIYVNASRQEDTELGRLMHDFHCKDAREMYSEILAGRMKELKETQKGVDLMCREMEKIYCEGEERGRTLGRAEGRAEGRVEGRAEGRVEGRVEGRAEGRAEGIVAGELKAKREMALSLAQMGLSGERIAEAAKVSAALVQEWLAGSLNPAK